MKDVANLRLASQSGLHQYFLAVFPWEDTNRMVYQRPVPEPSPTPTSGFSSIRRFRSDQSPVLLTSWMAKTFSPLLIRTKQYLPGCKCPANSSMVSHAINIAIFSLNGYNRLRSHRKAKERPGNGQGKAKGMSCNHTAKPRSVLEFQRLSGKLVIPLLVLTA